MHGNGIRLEADHTYSSGLLSSSVSKSAPMEMGKQQHVGQGTGKQNQFAG